FARCLLGAAVCVLGAGFLIIGFLALKRGKVKKVTAVELQPELFRYLKMNCEKLELGDRMDLVQKNWRQFGVGRPVPKFEVVISNPPYRKRGTGKLPPRTVKSLAKHELKGNLRDLLQCTARILKPRGRFYVLYPPLRLEELMQELPKVKLKAQRMAFVHPYAERPATQVMVEAVRAPTRDLKIEAPVVVYRDPEHYQADIEAYVGPKRHN
ncbi:MAG: RsmD family RNA methyltransferase, partial [bacterium]|nr:RsmD family RNA methyltransferase [bacterium]